MLIAKVTLKNKNTNIFLSFEKKNEDIFTFTAQFPKIEFHDEGDFSVMEERFFFYIARYILSGFEVVSKEVKEGWY